MACGQVGGTRPSAVCLVHRDSGEGADASSAGSQTTPSWEEGPIPQRLCSPSEGPWQVGEMGREELSEIQQKEKEGFAPEEE